MLTPIKEWARYTEQPPIRPMQATLNRSCGSWWLFWEDGKRTDLHHSSAHGNAYSKEDMIRMVTT